MTLLLPAEYTSHRTSVRRVLDGLKSASASDRAQAAAHTILDMELRAGSKLLIVDHAPMLFSGFTKQLIPVDNNNQRWAMHLAMLYGLNTCEGEVSPKITKFLASHVLWIGVEVSPRRWSAYVGGALHFSRYDGTVMRLTGAGVTEGPNNKLIDDGWRRRGPISADGQRISFATEDNGAHVLFADDDSGSIPRELCIGRNGELFKLLHGIAWANETASGMKPHHQVQVMMIWMLAVAFPDIFPTKPILLVEGAPGSGKSTILQMIQQTLFGAVEPFTVSEDGLRDFWVTMLRSPIMILDNTDDMIKWLPDQICAYTTRGVRTERKLHTNTGHVEIRPHSFIAVASKDPKSFRREDVADRSITLRLGARTHGGESLSALNNYVTNWRPHLWGEYVYYCNRAVAALALEPARLTTTRLGDFEIFAYAAARAFGWTPEKVIPPLMQALKRERAAFAAETDIVLDVLQDWIEIPSSIGREVTAQALFKELANIASSNNKLFVKSPQALAQRLRAPHIASAISVFDTIQGGKKVYQFFKPESGN